MHCAIFHTINLQGQHVYHYQRKSRRFADFFLYLTRGLIEFHCGGGLDGRDDVAWTNQGDVRHHHDAEVEQQ